MLTLCRILERVRSKHLEATLSFFDYSKAFDSKYCGRREQILLAYYLPKETVVVIMMLYKNTKVNVCSPDGYNGYFDVVAGVHQGDILALGLFIICLERLYIK